MSAEKTIEILDLFTMQTRELTVPQMAEMLKSPVSSVYRHLRILKAKGYVIEKQEGVYRLGYRFLEFANIVRADSSITEIAIPVMRETTMKTGETSILTIESNLQAVCLEQIQPYEPIKVSAQQGQVLPLHVGASSKTLLAFLPEDRIKLYLERNKLTKFTENTIVDKEALLEHLQAIREQGYAISDEEIDLGVVAYGVPILDSSKKLIAALSIAGPRERIISKSESELIETLMEAAKKIQKYF